MALTAFSGTNVGLQALTKQIDYANIGTLSALDTTGINIDVKSYGGAMFTCHPTSYVGDFIVSGTIDGTNYVELSKVTNPSAAFYVAIGGNFTTLNVKNSTHTSGTMTVIAERVPAELVSRSFVFNSNG